MHYNEDSIRKSFSEACASLSNYTKNLIDETDKYLLTFTHGSFVFRVTEAEKLKYEENYLRFSLEITKFTKLTGAEIFRLSRLTAKSDLARAPELTKKIAAVLESYYLAEDETATFLDLADGIFTNEFNHARLLNHTRKLKSALEIFKGATENEEIHTFA